MAICTNCNNEVKEGAKFCEFCGTPVSAPPAETPAAVEEPAVVEIPAEEIAVAEVPAEETPVEEAPVVEAPAAEEIPAVAAPINAPAKKKKSPKLALILGCAVLAVAAAAVAVLLLLSGNKAATPENNYALYIKDGELYYNALEGDESIELTSKLLDFSYDNEDIYDNAYNYARFAYMSEDGKYLFFPDRIAYDAYGIDLYYKEVDDLEEKAVKVDSAVVSYSVNASGTLVTYLKGEARTLYQYDMETDDRIKIASKVEAFMTTPDGRTVGYMNNENDIYVYTDGDKAKVASGVSSLEYVDPNLTYGYYLKEDTLYKQELGSEPVKIAENVAEVVRAYASGEVCYVTNAASLVDLIDDDKKESDASISYPTKPTAPTRPNYPYSWNYDTDEEYEAAYAAYQVAYAQYKTDYLEYEEAYDRYWDDYDAYYEKLDRDELREDLKEREIYFTVGTLCFFDGEKEVVITDYYYDYYDTSFNIENVVLSYCAYDPSNLEKVKLSEITSARDASYMVREALEAAADRYIAVKSSATKIGTYAEISSVYFTTSGTTLAYVSDKNEEGAGTLYTRAISEDGLGTPEVYDDDVDMIQGFYDDIPVYLKDYEDSYCELYVNGERVDSDVLYYSTSYESGMLFYYTEEETLKVYDGEKAVRIADDVDSYTVLPDGRVLYLQDYDHDDYVGELRIWDDGETEKLDDDVTYLLTTTHNTYGYYFGY